MHISHTSPHVLEDPTVPFYSVSPHVVFLIFKNLHKSDVTTRPQLDYNSHPPRVDVTNIHWVWINFLQRMSTEDTAAPQWPLLKCFQPPATPGRPVPSGRCPPLVGVPPWLVSPPVPVPVPAEDGLCESSSSADHRPTWEQMAARRGKCRSDWTRTRRSQWSKEWR